MHGVDVAEKRANIQNQSDNKGTQRYTYIENEKKLQMLIEQVQKGQSQIEGNEREGGEFRKRQSQ